MDPARFALDPARLPGALRRAVRALAAGGPAGLRRWLRRSELGSSVSYSDWITLNDSRDAATHAGWAARALALRAPPRLSLALLAPGGAAPLGRALEAIRAQVFGGWELLVLLPPGAGPEARAAAAAAAADPRVRIAEGLGADPWARAPALATGTHLALLTDGELLAPHALLAAAERLAARPDCALLYADHDRLDAAGVRSEPFFKPDFAPELCWSLDLLAPFCLVRTDLLRAAPEPAPPLPARAARYALHLGALRAAGAAEVAHLPFVLCHQAPPAPDPAEEQAALDVLRAHLREAWPGATAGPGPLPGTRRVRPPPLARPPLVSVIVPTRDGGPVLRRFAEGLLERTAWPSLELLVVDNGSRDPETLALLDALEAGDRARVLRDDSPFNFSALNNRAARAARGELLLLCNDDLEVQDPGWIAELAGHALRPEVGAVGARLLYPDGTVQHAGVAGGVLGAAAHLFRGLPADAPGPHGLAQLLRGSTIVTAACLMVRRELYLRAGGLDERLAVAFNDVDLCLRLAALGLRNLFVPGATLTHHESWSRGDDQASTAKRERFADELCTLLLRWPHLDRDPLYNRNLSLASDRWEPARTPRPP